MKNNKIILFSNIKGGVGKSTLCMLFAHYLAGQNMSVGVVDADIQRTITRQRQRDAEKSPESAMPWDVVSVFDYNSDGNAENLIPILKNQDGWVLVDCPGNMEADRLIPLFEEADVVVIPTSFEEPDIDATLSLFVPLLKQLNKQAKIIFVPNRINEKLQKNMDEIRVSRNKVKSSLGQFGYVTARIKDCVVFEPHRFNTINRLDRYQQKAVEYAFNGIINNIQ